MAMFLHWPSYIASTKGEDQNVHVIIYLSHLKNLYSIKFSVEMRKIVDFCVEKENGAINMT